MQPDAPSVIIVGGGASAVFVAYALRERAFESGAPVPTVTVVGRESEVGRGLAYGRADAHHRLNSPAGKMSLSAVDDQAFVRWLGDTGWRDVDGSTAGPGSFVPRRVFGDYVVEAFRQLVDDPGAQVRFVRGDVIDAALAGDETAVTLADGTVLTGDRVVIAVGNPAPGVVPSAVARTVADPWAPGALDGIGASDRILLIGTGLTTIDVATSLARRLPGVRLTATSRHLLLPAVHLSAPAAPGPGLGDEPTTLPAMMRAFAGQLRLARAGGQPWQAVLDGVRPEVQQLWTRLSDGDRRRFLDHVARRWDVHRHRMAPLVWAELEGLLDAGTLTLEADVDHSTFDVSINCTGPRPVVAAGWNPIVDALLRGGTAVADPTGLGFAADADGALVSADHTPEGRIFSIGAALKGALWETVAIGEIRQLAYRIAGRVLEPVAVTS